MSTLEHLFMQISERRDWIEGQLRQQAESYCQTLAYNIVADGGRPPPWLWAAGPGNASRPDPIELNREQLISEILFPLPRTTTSVAHHNTLFTLPNLKGDHVYQSNSFFSEMCALNKYFTAEHRDKAAPNSYYNGNEQDSDMMVEPKVVEAYGEFDPFARVQRSRSRQRDIEIRLSKKAKTTNHLGEATTVDENSGRMNKSRVASAKADCVKKSLNSLLLHSEDGDRVTWSRFTDQKLDCLEKSVQPARHLDFVEDAAHQETETEMDCGPAPPVNVDNLALNNMDDMAPLRCATGTVGKEHVSYESCPVHSGLEVRLSKKAKATNHLGEESTMDKNSVKVDCLKRSSISLLLHNEDGDSVARTNFTPQKLDCLEKSVNPAKLLDLVETVTHKAIETERDHRPIPPLNAVNLALNNIDDMAPHRCATGTVGKEPFSDAAHSLHSGLKMTHVIVSERSEILSLVEPKKLLFDDIKECGLNEKSAILSEKENQGFSSEIVLTDLEAMQSAKEDPCEDFKKAIGSIGSKQLQEDTLHTEEGMCRTEESDRISNREPDKEKLEFNKTEDSECHSQPASSNKPFLIPSLPLIEATCCISENASMHSSPMRDSTSNSTVSAKQDVSRKSSSGTLVKDTTEEQSSGKLVKKLTSVVASVPPETNPLVNPKHLLCDSLEKHNLNNTAAALEKDPDGSYSEIDSRNLETVQSVKELSCKDSTTTYISSDKGQLPVGDAFLTAELMRGTKEKVSGGGQKDRFELLETIESECDSHRASCSSNPSQLPAISSLKVISGSSNNAQNNSSTVTDCMISSVVNLSSHWIILQDADKKLSFGRPVHCTIGQKCTEKIIRGTSDSPIQLVNTFHNDGSALFSPETNEVLLEAEQADSAAVEVKKKSVSQPIMMPDATETQNVLLEFRHLLGNSATNNRISGSGKSNGFVLPSNKSGEYFSAQGTVVNTSTRDVVEKFIVGNTPNTAEICEAPPKSHYFLRSSRSFGTQDVAGKSSVRLTLTPNSLETRNVPPKSQYFLRSLTSQEKNVASTKIIGNNEASSSTQSVETISRACEISWPKRKKMGFRSNNILATSPRLRRLKPLLHIQDGIDCRCKKTSENADCRCKKPSENASGAVIEHQPFHLLRETETDISNAASKSPLEILHQSEKGYMIEGGSYLKGKDHAVVTPFPIEQKQEEPFPDLAHRNSRAYLKDEVKATEWNILKLKTLCTSKEGKDYLCGENTLEHIIPKSSCCYEEFTKEREMCDVTAGLSHLDDDLVGSDETMPEYEGFSIGVPSVMEDEIFFNDSDLPRLTEERASMIEQLCRSRSLLTPGSRTSTKYKIYEIPDVYQSLPAGLLEHMNLNNSFQFSDVDMKQFRASEDGRITGLRCNLGSEFDGSFVGRSYLHSMPSSSTRSGSEARKPPLTPQVEKFGQRMISGRGGASSEKEGSNPELTCFRIDENSSTTDENGYLVELDASGEMVGSRGIKGSTNRKALVDVSAAYQNSSSLVSVSKEFLERGSLESVNTESYFGTQMGVYSGLGKGYPSKSKSMVDEKENHALSISGKRVQKAGGSFRNRSSKPEISGKANERNKSRANQVKGCKPNNIVSNVSSFVPLVRQKQEPTQPVKGKKDIKVKALEAAEAAKRLEERKHHERDMRKAAAKLERERLEQENVKRLELKQKKREENRKKEADISTRKRHREEEERKKKERKRRCTEETRKHQKEQEERLRSEKEEKEFRRKAADEIERRKNELGEAATRQLKSEKGVAGYRKATKAEPIATKVVAKDARHDSDTLGAHDVSVISDDIKEVVRNSDSLQEAIQDGISITKESSDLQSYEMSPYIDSDDEDGEEESRRKRKYIPLWARRECLYQIILSKKGLDPAAVFSCKRSFNLSEVLLPRIRRAIL